MNSTIVSLIAFGCTFSAAMAGLYIRSRLPAHHIEGDSKDVVKLVMGLIATITALVLGLLISSTHTAYDAQEAELQQLSIHLYQIDRILAYFGPDASDQRSELHRMVAEDIERIWPGAGGGGGAIYAPLAEQRAAERIFEGVAKLPVKTDFERFAQGRALQLLGGIGETRRLLVEQSHGSLSWPFLFVLISWMTILFFGFGLCTRYNPTVVTALLVGSLSVSGAVFLILEMNHPYSGWMQVSSAPLREALAQMNR